MCPQVWLRCGTIFFCANDGVGKSLSVEKSSAVMVVHIPKRFVVFGGGKKKVCEGQGLFSGTYIGKIIAGQEPVGCGWDMQRRARSTLYAAVPGDRAPQRNPAAWASLGRLLLRIYLLCSSPVDNLYVSTETLQTLTQ